MPRTMTTGTSATSPPSSSSSSSPFDHRLSYRLTKASWDTAGDTPGSRCTHKERRKKKPSQALVISFVLAESKPSSSPSRSWSPIPPKLPFLPYFFPFETLNCHRSPILCHRRPLPTIKNHRGIRRPLRIPSDFSGGGSAAGEGGEGGGSEGGVGGGGGGKRRSLRTLIGCMSILFSLIASFMLLLLLGLGTFIIESFSASSSVLGFPRSVNQEF